MYLEIPGQNSGLMSLARVLYGLGMESSVAKRLEVGQRRRIYRNKYVNSDLAIDGGQDMNHRAMAHVERSGLVFLNTLSGLHFQGI